MSATQHTEAVMASATNTPVTEGPKAHACVLCQQRKVKCDRKDPCATCIKVRAKCVFRAPAAPRRRPRKSPESILLLRLKRYEELLRGFGVKVEALNGETEITRQVEAMGIVTQNSTIVANGDPGQKTTVKQETGPPTVENGKMVVKNGKTRYLDNKLWTHLSDEFMEVSDILPVSSEDEGDYDPPPYPREPSMDLRGADLLLGCPSTSSALRLQHPDPIQGFRLWQAFLDNVNPLTKLLHAPTVQQTILTAMGNLDEVPKTIESLMFAIYASAVCSLSNDECESIMGESRSVALSRFQAAAKQALVNASLLKSSNIVVLQAYMLFLHSTRQTYDSISHWVLTGVAIRIAQRFGLHRDGVDLQLPVFETEMRRRLWWQIILLEARGAEFSGVSQTSHGLEWTTRIPSNLNDSALHPSMKELPAEQNSPTEMMHCLIRYEFGQALKRATGQSTYDGSMKHLSSSEVAVKTKEQAIQRMETLLEQKYLQYCDPAIPLHFISILVASSILCKMRFRAYHPRHYWARRESIEQSEKDTLFAVCVKMLENHNIFYANSNTRKFGWHVEAQLQFDSLVHVLSELRFRTAVEQANGAWHQVDGVFQNNPALLTDKKKGLNVAMSRLAARAWDNYERATSHDPYSRYQMQSSHFREMLSSRVDASKPVNGNDAATNLGSTDLSQPITAVQDSAIDALAQPVDFNALPMDTTPVDWSAWDNLLQDFDSQQSTLAF